MDASHALPSHSNGYGGARHPSSPSTSAAQQQQQSYQPYGSRRIDPQRRVEQEVRARAHDAFASAVLSQAGDSAAAKTRYR